MEFPTLGFVSFGVDWISRSKRFTHRRRPTLGHMFLCEVIFFMLFGSSLASLESGSSMGFINSGVSRPGLESGVEALLARACQETTSTTQCYRQMVRLNPAVKRLFLLNLQNVCPPGADLSSCVYHNINNALQPFTTNDDRHPSFTTKGARSLNQGVLCPRIMDTIKCFDNYMMLWLNVVHSKEGKRTFGPGKRSKSPIISSDSESMGRNEESRSDSLVKLFLMCRGDADVMSCVERHQDQDPKHAMTRELIAHKRNMVSLCSQRDPVDCFEHFMVELARYEGTKKIKGFIGRR